MAKAPISLQFYPGDRLRELMPVLTDSEAIGAWCKAWMYLWGAGPSKPETVAQVAGKGWERVGFLFREENGLLSLEWMEEKRVETDAFKARQAANGRKGGRPKSTNTKKENPSLSSGLTQKETKKSPRKEGEVEEEVIQEGKERAKEPLVVKIEDARFETLWANYGRIGSKPEALRYWRALSEPDRMAIEAKLPAYVASTPGGAFRKHLQGWINPKNRMWESAIVTVNTSHHGPVAKTQSERDAELAAIVAARYATQ